MYDMAATLGRTNPVELFEVPVWAPKTPHRNDGSGADDAHTEIGELGVQLGEVAVDQRR